MIEITQVNASLDEAGDENACLIVGKRVAKRVLRCKDSEIKSIELHRKSIDARKKRDVHFILSFRVELTSPHLEREAVDSVAKRDRSRVRAIEDDEPSFPSPVSDAPQERPVVVGAGCAGLFAALTLAEAGLKPLLIERGDPAFRRSQAIDLFLKERILDPESNIQFGLGGAGTFSDGKLNTGTKNPAHRLILETFVEAGAPRVILWDAKPHIGSDILPKVVTAISQRIEQLGGVVRYRTKLVDIRIDASGAITGIDVQSSQDAAYEPIETKHLILACGHSARDIFELLKDHNVALAQKTFAMGVRIEHPQRDIDRAQYGASAGHPALGAAPYKLVAHLPNGRSVFSFCMCPGGQVVAASSEPCHLCVNGASLNARDGRNANAALLVNVTPEDLPNDDPLAGIELQRACEAAAYRLGGSNWNAPAQLVGAFLDMVENHKMIVENSGLLTVAALKQLDLKGKKAVAILSGGNMDVITMSSIVQHGLIQRDRIFSASVLLPDKPGQLALVAQTIADAQGNVIKLEHNQFVSTNRNAAVELRITMEAYGTEHKNQIMKALEEKGFRPREIGAKLY